MVSNLFQNTSLVSNAVSCFRRYHLQFQLSTSRGRPQMGLGWALDGPQMGSRTLKMLLKWSPICLRTLHWSQIRFRASEGIICSSNCLSHEAAAAVHILTPKPTLFVWNPPFVKLCTIHPHSRCDDIQRGAKRNYSSTYINGIRSPGSRSQHTSPP